MRFEKLADCNLKIIANNVDRHELKEAFAKGGYPEAEAYVNEALHEQLEFIPERFYEKLGCLTSSPLLSDYFYLTDDGENYMMSGYLWWFPNYQVICPWTELKNKGYVEFELGGDFKNG